MQSNEIEKYVEFLLSAALQKCGNIYDAEDIAQDTLLAALAYLSQGKEIRDARAWLLTVMNRKFNSMLRRKYRQPTIGIGDDFEMVDDSASVFLAEQDDEACNIRQAVAYLSKNYREVLVRYYMNGQSIADIARELNIPEGTVKSRLYLGRNQVKKGINNMEKYSKQSYSPVTLRVTNSGQWGRNGEPMSLVNHDLIAQNILWFTYERPVSMEEISSALGIPTAYVEPIVQRLAEGELMQSVGGKYYTDFMISTVKDQERYIPEQKQLVQKHFDVFWSAIEKGLKEIRDKDFYKKCSFDARNSLEMYFAFHCLDYGLHGAFSNIFDTKQIFPDRPNGGKWIAFGNVYFEEFNPMEHVDLMACAYSGERWVRFENFIGSETIEMHVYGADGFPAYSYDRSPEYTFFKASDDRDSVFIKLLYLLHTGTDPEVVGFNTEYLRAIPWLKKCKILVEKEGKIAVNIPVLNRLEWEELWNICKASKSAMITEQTELKALLAKFYSGKKQVIPRHLKSVPLQKQYLHAGNAMLFTTIREAMQRGKLYDGHYDEENQFPCPMVLMIEEGLKKDYLDSAFS